MRAPRFRPVPPDLLSRALGAHGLAEDRGLAACRLAEGLRERARRAEAAAAERERLSRQALCRGDESWGLSLDDAARDARRSAAECRERLAVAERQAAELARAERARRADLFQELERFLLALEGR